jgi:ribosomal protein S18 acetylase RimI-like enzyme
MGAFFTEHVDVEYISHGEILCGRAVNSERWADNLTDIVTQELVELVDHPEVGSALVIECDTKAVGLAIYKKTGRNSATLEDVIIHKEFRNHGIGSWFMQEFEALLRNEGITSMLLESGVNNVQAHKFFERHGCTMISHTFLKTLSA